MAETIATGYIQIEPSAQGIKGKLESALGGDATSAGKSLGGKLGTAMGAAAKVGVAGVVAATGAVAAFGKASVDAGKNFDASMSQVAATMGYSVEEINKEGSVANQTFSQLSNFAQQMGATTAFSASEAADALNYMALAGYDAETSMTMLPNVLNLAAAGGIDLASASDMVTDAQSALGLSLKETSVMVDQMAKTASKSNTSVSQLGEALLTIGATGKNVKGGTQELSQMLGVLADNGIKASEGGTHLRNILLAMNPTTDKASAAWERLGVSGYDAQGNLRPLQDTFLDLSKAMQGMTDEEKTRTLTSMFNKTDLASVNALLGTSAQRYNELSGAIGNASGAAETMANTQLDNLEGDITLFMSALEGVQIQVSSMLTPAIRDFVQIASTGLGEIAKSLQSGDIGGAFESLGTMIGDAINKIGESLPQIMEASERLLSAFGNALLDNMPVLMQSAIDVVASFGQYVVEATPQLLGAALQIIGQLMQGITDNAPQIFQSAVELVQNLAQGLAEQAPILMPQAVNMILTLVTSLLDNIDLLVDAAIQLQMGLAEGIINSLPILIEKAPTIVLKLASAIISNAPKLLAAPYVLMGQLVKGILSCIPQLIKAGGDIVVGIWNGIKNRWTQLVEDAKALASNLVGALKSFFSIGSPSKLMEDEIGKWIPEGIAVGIDATADSPIKAIDSMSDDMTSTLQSQIASDVALSPVYTSNTTDIATSDTQGLFDLMSQYFPQMANQSVNISLEGDAAGLFNAVRRQDTLFSKANGRSAFA